MPGSGGKDSFWQQRYESINDHEAPAAQRTRIIKFFLHVSKKEQKKRLLPYDDPNKRWKFSPNDLSSALWDYMQAYARPRGDQHGGRAWYCVPADDKKNARSSSRR